MKRQQEILKSIYRKAFTLSELLITLGLIGIVASLTIPDIINKYQEKVTVVKVKKFYTVMNQALMMATVDNGYVDEWSYINAGIDAPDYAELG